MERRNKRTRTVGNGEGSLYYSEKLGCLVFQYYYNNKRQTAKQKKNESNKEFKARVTSIKNELNTGTYVEKSKETLYNICKEIIDDKRNFNETCPSTYNRALYTLSYIESGNIAHLPIQKITAKMLKDFLQTITIYAQTTIDKIYQLLGQAFRRAMDRRYILENPMTKEEVKKPKSSKPARAIESLTVEEHQHLLEVLQNQEKNHKYQCIILLMLFTGMRIGEVLALRYDHIKEQLDQKNKYFKVYDTLTRDENDYVILRDEDEAKTKTKKSTRWIDITPEVEQILSKAVQNYVINPDKLLFYDEIDCCLIKPSEVNNYLRRINTKYNIAKHIHNHMLRHTYATRLIEAGTDIDVIKNKLGHKNIETTINTYCSLLELRRNRQNELISQFYENNKMSLSI